MIDWVHFLCSEAAKSSEKNANAFATSKLSMFEIRVCVDNGLRVRTGTCRPVVMRLNANNYNCLFILILILALALSRQIVELLFMHKCISCIVRVSVRAQ